MNEKHSENFEIKENNFLNSLIHKDWTTIKEMIIDGYIYKNCSFNLNQLPLNIQQDIIEKIDNRYYSPPQRYLSYNYKPYNAKAYLSDILFLNKQYDLLDLLIEQKFSDNWEAYLNLKTQINNKINNSPELEKEQPSLFKTYNIFDFLDKDNPIKSLENFLNHYNKQKSLTARISTRNIVGNIKDCFKCLQINKNSLES